MHATKIANILEEDEDYSLDPFMRSASIKIEGYQKIRNYLDGKTRKMYISFLINLILRHAKNYTLYLSLLQNFIEILFLKVFLYIGLVLHYGKRKFSVQNYILLTQNVD